MSGRPPLSPQQNQEYRDRLIAAAFRVVASTGDPDPPVRPILREAGLSRQAFYRCFESKEDLMAALLSEGQQILATYLGARMQRVSSPEDKIRAWISGVMRQATAPQAAERTRPFLFLPSAQAPAGQAATADKERLLCQPLEAAIAARQRELLGADDDPGRLALIIHDFVFGSLNRHLLIGLAPTAETVEALEDFALRAVGVLGSEVFAS
jgi:AcrR family transcriptional regulator